MAYKLNTQFNGEVLYDKGIILSVIQIATSEIEGVSSLAHYIGEPVVKNINKNFGSGVRVTWTEKGLVVNVYVNVKFAYNITETAYKIQDNIKNTLNTTTDIAVHKVNVHVVGVDFKN